LWFFKSWNFHRNCRIRCQFVWKKSTRILIGIPFNAQINFGRLGTLMILRILMLDHDISPHLFIYSSIPNGTVITTIFHLLSLVHFPGPITWLTWKFSQSWVIWQILAFSSFRER
jgi:hypothetical protein